MNLTGDNLFFRPPKPRANPTRIFVLLILIIISLFLLRSVNAGEIKPFFSPTSTPTRAPSSFALEGQTHFASGDLNKSIQAYQKAIELDKTNTNLMAELARIQVYSSTLLTTDRETKQRLTEALATIDAAVKIAPEDSMVHAVRAFALNWNANPVLAGDKAEGLLTQAEQAAVRALQLDNQNTLALAFYAEILLDEQKWLQSEQYIKQALEKNPNLMDVHRINAYIQETLGNYSAAIKAYQEAVKISPNLTFLYLRIGANFRQLKNFERALEYFDKAVRINENLGVKDPIPYLAISRTYSQMGEFFIASRNVEKAIKYNPTSPDVYAQLGIIYFKGRNYEGSIPALRCAIQGCNAAVSCEVRKCDAEKDPAIEITGMALSVNTVVYYYTLGSVLAAMHRSDDNYCVEAMDTLNQVRSAFSSDPSIMSIVAESEKICATFGQATSP